MLTKTVKPIVSEAHSAIGHVDGTVIEYRFLGLLIYKKTLLTPITAGMEEWQGYFTTF